jgi:hypothetical protein
MRIYTLRIIFKDSPNPWTLENVSNMTTEGPLLRITQGPKLNTWFPLCNVFSVTEVSREDKTLVGKKK